MVTSKTQHWLSHVCVCYVKNHKYVKNHVFSVFKNNSKLSGKSTIHTHELCDYIYDFFFFFSLDIIQLQELPNRLKDLGAIHMQHLWCVCVFKEKAELNCLKVTELRGSLLILPNFLLSLEAIP